MAAFAGEDCPGFIHFRKASDQITTPLNPSTHFALDTGVVLLRYFPNHFYIRFDGGATIIDYARGLFGSGERAASEFGGKGAPLFAPGWECIFEEIRRRILRIVFGGGRGLPPGEFLRR